CPRELSGRVPERSPLRRGRRMRLPGGLGYGALGIPSRRRAGLDSSGGHRAKRGQALPIGQSAHSASPPEASVAQGAYGGPTATPGAGKGPSVEFGRAGSAGGGSDRGRGGRPGGAQAALEGR